MWPVGIVCHAYSSHFCMLPMLFCVSFSGSWAEMRSLQMKHWGQEAQTGQSMAQQWIEIFHTLRLLLSHEIQIASRFHIDVHLSFCIWLGAKRGKSKRYGSARKKGGRVSGTNQDGRSVSMEVKRDLRNTIIVPTLTFASEILVWNESQRSRVQAVEMSYLRSACGVIIGT